MYVWCQTLVLTLRRLASCQRRTQNLGGLEVNGFNVMPDWCMCIQFKNRKKRLLYVKLQYDLT